MENKDILLRASGIGALAIEKKGTGITDKQLEEIEGYKQRIRDGKKLTEIQKGKFQMLNAKRDAPFELSDTGRAFVEGIWLLNNKGYYKQLSNPYVDKGIYGEEDAITLLSEVDKMFYKKNTIRKIKGNISGECDIDSVIGKTKVTQDTKCCWDPRTFMSADLSTLYEFQGRTYVHLYDTDEFWLRYCLVDAPPHIVAREKEKIWYKYYSNSMDDKTAQELEVKLQPLMDQVERNLVYSTSGRYTKEERVKTFKVERDDKLFKEKILDRVPAALEYYHTIKLNQIC